MTTNITTPVGRLVGGSLYKPQDKDATGQPLVVKSGPNVGKPMVRYWLPLAIPKGPEKHWKETPWGAAIWAEGAAAFPTQHLSPSFAWKVVDGDSQVPNKAGRKPCDNEGYKGCWVLNFGGTYAPKAVNNNGSEFHPEPDYIKPGYWVQIAGSVSGNNTQANPGVYLNYSLVSLQGFGEEIVSGPDATAVGFGTAPLPAGVSQVPVGAMTASSYAVAPGQLPAGYSHGGQPSPTTVAPHPGFLQPPPALPPVAAPLPPATPVMTAKAAGHTYESMKAAGWTDELLKAHGYMV